MAEKKTSRGDYGSYASDPAGGYYDKLVRSLLDEYLSYGDFAYNPESDPAWLSYRDSYTRRGRDAMRDAYAEASGMTGGYGNSYAAAAGSLAYDEWLGKLNDLLPELYQTAYKRYSDGLDAAYKRYRTAGDYYGSLLDRYYADRKFRYQADSDMANDEYKRERDALNDAYKRERDAVKDSQWERRYLLDRQRYFV